MDKKLVEITCKYSDGTSKILDGEQLEKWMKLVKELTDKASNLNINPPWHTIKWYNLGKEKHY